MIPLQTILEVAHNFTVFWIDIWGVLHNGNQLFPECQTVLTALRDLKKTVVLLSNAPRMPEFVSNRLLEMGLTRDLYHGIYTSGYQCHTYLKNRPIPFYHRLGSNLYHIGPSRDNNIFDTLPYSMVPSVNEADFLLITGIHPIFTSIHSLDDIFRAALIKKLPCVCANADETAFFGETQFMCAGSIAKHYAAMGGEVYIHGKPCLGIFEDALSYTRSLTKDCVSHSDIVMIGDSLKTDIIGAFQFGLSTIWIGSGIHRTELKLHTPSELAVEFDIDPTYFIPELK